jgi:hypothetical protein
VNRSPFFVLLILLALVVPSLLAQNDAAKDELDANRAQLELMRRDPQELERLRHNLKAFNALPPARREQISKLHADLRAEKDPTHLWNVLERYAEWVERLPNVKDRKTIEESSLENRVAIIQTIRALEWVNRQPEALRKQWDRMPGLPEKALWYSKQRDQERKRRKEWQDASRFWTEVDTKRPLPTHYTHLDPVAQNGIKEYLLPMLAQDELQQLQNAQGRWPQYMWTLIALADLHPLALPGERGIVKFEDLPAKVQRMFGYKAGLKQPTPSVVRDADGKWPGFAIAVVEFNKKRKPPEPLPNELWACDSASLLPPMKEYIEKVLLTAITKDEEKSLRGAEGKWPDYPKTIADLADKYQLPRPPWQTALLGPSETWDRYRETRPDLPEVPRFVLREYAQSLPSEQQAKLASGEQLYRQILPVWYDKIGAQLMPMHNQAPNLNGERKLGPFPFPGFFQRLPKGAQPRAG